MPTNNPSSLKNILDSVIDKDGIKTDVNVTMTLTTETSLKIVLTATVSGVLLFTLYKIFF